MSSGKATLDTLIRADPTFTVVGTWLSLVEHSLGVRGVGSSNLPVPTNSKKRQVELVAQSAMLSTILHETSQALIELSRIIPERPVPRIGYHLNLSMSHTGLVLIDGS